MPMLNTFDSDVFSAVSLTTALNKIPYQPNWLADQGLFQTKGIITENAVIEERQGVLSLVNTSARGTTQQTENRPNRAGRSFLVPHIALTAGIEANDVQSIRAFGSETAMETLASKVNEVMLDLRADIEVTKEFMRVGAIQGIVLDGDASTEVFNYYDEFNVTEREVDINFSTPDNIKDKIVTIQRATDVALGGTGRTGLVALCGDDYFDALTQSAEVTVAYDRWNEGLLFRTTQHGGAGFFVGPDGQIGFQYAGCMFFNYRGTIGSTAFIPTAVARFFPTGVPQLFQEIYAPADYEETVNTTGLPFYAKQERKRFDKGRDLEVQSNPFIVCTRPGALTKSTGTFS